MRIGRGTVALALVGSVACSYVRSAANRVASATVAFADAGGQPRGTGILWQDPLGVVHMDLKLVGLTPGTHGIHFHSVGACDGSTSTAFSSAGSHFNPTGKRHGLSAVDGPHAGDLPNFTVRSDGTASVEMTGDRVSLTSGAANLLDSDGASIVVHAAADDQITDPAGNSGARVACAIVVRGP